MVIVFGTCTAGQADVVDGRFSVATEFLHVMWLPLVPVASRVIVDKKVADKYGLAPPPDMPPDETEQAEPPVEDAAPPEPAEPPAEEAAPPGSAGPRDMAEEAASEPPLDTDTRELRYSIPMSGRSVLLGYLRGWGFWLGILLGFLGGMLALMSGDDAEAGRMFPNFLYVAGGGILVAMGSYYGPWNRATPQRAKQLCEAIGMDPKTLPEELR